jgi:glycosyltransferase involved in cell wall biosynthesis
MSSGCIVISNETTGSAEVITNLKDGILCGPISGHTLESALRYAKTGAIDLEFIRTNAIQKVNNFFNQEKNFMEILKVVSNDNGIK